MLSNKPIVASFGNLKVVVATAQLKSLAYDELIDRLLSVENISQQMTNHIN